METKAKGLTVLVIIVAVATCALAASASAPPDSHSSGVDTGWMEQYAPYEEITSLRGYSVKHFDMGNGERVAVVGQGLLHYYDGEKFEDIPDLPFPEGIELVDEKDEHYIMSFPDWCTARVEDEGSILRCYDKKNTSIYEFKDLIVVAKGVSPHKKIVGSDGEEKTVIDNEKVDYCQFKVIDNKMYLVVPENLSNTYPLQAYDDVIRGTNNMDSALREDSSDGQYGSNTYYYVKAGPYYYDEDEETWIKQRRRIVMDWTLPGGTEDISAIKLLLYKYGSTGASSYNVEVHEILESFNEGEVTWNDRAGETSWTKPGCDSPTSSSSTIVDSIPRTTSSYEWHTWDLGPGATNSMGITWGSNFGITLRESANTGEAVDYEKFRSKEYTVDTSLRPYIEITYSPPTSAPFMINGWVLCENGTACNNPTVNITNSNTSTQWQAETNVSYSYYQLILDTTNISAGNVLEFSASGCSQANTTEHTVTQDEIDGGGFELNITLELLIISCDADGNERSEFASNETVHVKGSGLSENTNYKLWIQDNPVCEGYVLCAANATHGNGANVSVQTDADGSFEPTLLWTVPSDAAHHEYDIVADKQDDDGTGRYNAASDGIDSATTYGFVAPIPELASIILFAVGLLMLIGLVRFRRRE